MDRAEAQQVTEVLAAVDGYCSTCAKDAAEDIAQRIPKVDGEPFDWPAAVQAAQTRYWEEP